METQHIMMICGDFIFIPRYGKKWVQSLRNPKNEVLPLEVCTRTTRISFCRTGQMTMINFPTRFSMTSTNLFHLACGRRSIQERTIIIHAIHMLDINKPVQWSQRINYWSLVVASGKLFVFLLSMYLIFDISVSCDNLLIFINNVDELSVCWRKIGGGG